MNRCPTIGNERGPATRDDTLLVTGDDRGRVQSGMLFGPLRSAFSGRTLDHSRADNLALAELTVLDTLVGRSIKKIPRL